MLVGLLGSGAEIFPMTGWEGTMNADDRYAELKRIVATMPAERRAELDRAAEVVASVVNISRDDLMNWLIEAVESDDLPLNVESELLVIAGPPYFSEDG